MNLLSAKNAVLEECNREKKIVTRNIIVIGVLVLIAIALIAKFLLPSLTIYTGEAVDEVNSNQSFSSYIKWIIPIGFLLSLAYPLMALIKVFKRKTNAEKAFDLMEKGEETSIITDHTTYLTIIPLVYVKFNLDPVTYLEITINNKPYSLPVNQHLLPELKRAVSNANIAFYESVMSEIYGDKQVDFNNKEVSKIHSVQEFQQFADKEFSAEVSVMEQGRSKNKNMLYLQFLMAFGFLGGMVWFTSNPSAIQNSGDVFKIIGGFLVISTLVSYGFYFYSKKNSSGTGNYTQFKKSIFSRLIRYINPKFEYIEKAHIGLPELLHSDLLVEKNYTIGGSDQIIGHHNGVPFQSCNLLVTYRPNFRSEKEGDDVVFSGNYFVARFPKKFRSSISIYPKKGFFSGLKDNNIGEYLNISGEKIRLEDPDFQKQFEVHCDDQILARYILTPAFMERLKTINTRNKGNMYIAINESNIVIATNRQNATEAGNSVYGMMFTKIDMKLLNEMYVELTEQLSTIDTLKLNNEIWKN